MRVDVLREVVFRRCFWPGWFCTPEHDLAFLYRIIACLLFRLGFRWLGVAPCLHLHARAFCELVCRFGYFVILDAMLMTWTPVSILRWGWGVS
jgi:hypothetical protein